MGKTWVLHTETKGTGAQVVPLESVTKRSSVQAPVFVPREPAPREPEAVKPRPPRRFRVVDVMTRQELADDVGAREAVEALRDVRSIVDVNVFVWEEGHQRWRMLTFAERHALWALAGHRPGSVASST